MISTIKFNKSYCQVFINDKEITLSEDLYNILLFLAQNKRIIPIEDLKSYEYQSNETIKTKVCKINKAFNTNNHIIKNKRGLGYFLRRDLKVEVI